MHMADHTTLPRWHGSLLASSDERIDDDATEEISKMSSETNAVSPQPENDRMFANVEQVLKPSQSMLGTTNQPTTAPTITHSETKQKGKHGGRRDGMRMWTPAEDNVLKTMYDKSGPDWKMIAGAINTLNEQEGTTSHAADGSLPPRTPAMVRNRFLRIRKGMNELHRGRPSNKRGAFNLCAKCGQPKKGHTCPGESKEEQQRMKVHNQNGMGVGELEGEEEEEEMDEDDDVPRYRSMQLGGLEEEEDDNDDDNVKPPEALSRHTTPEFKPFASSALAPHDSMNHYRMNKSPLHHPWGGYHAAAAQANYPTAQAMAQAIPSGIVVETAEQRLAEVDAALSSLCKAFEKISQEAYDEQIIFKEQMPSLIQLLTFGPLSRKAKAAWIASRLSSEHHDAMVNQGALPPLVAMLSGGVGSEAAQGASFALSQLAYNSERRSDAIAAAGAIPPLRELVRSGGARTKAADALRNMAANSARCHAEIAALKQPRPDEATEAAQALSSLMAF